MAYVESGPHIMVRSFNLFPINGKHKSLVEGELDNYNCLEKDIKVHPDIIQKRWILKRDVR